MSVEERLDDLQRLETPSAYEAFRETAPCRRCGEGESWTVKGPDGLCIGQSWTGDDAECNAEEMAQALNAAYELGRASRDDVATRAERGDFDHLDDDSPAASTEPYRPTQAAKGGVKGA